MLSKLREVFQICFVFFMLWASFSIMTVLCDFLNIGSEGLGLVIRLVVLFAVAYVLDIFRKVIDTVLGIPSIND